MEAPEVRGKQAELGRASCSLILTPVTSDVNKVFLFIFLSSKLAIALCSAQNGRCLLPGIN
jgi:hypothetical protein